ncbi:MAG: aminopeptidase, partial [Nanoarchaeota archaeon]|nr:aminopeptidase [Nanoarchaeota archaeon]
DKVGEFSMTDRRFSRITKFMAQTLFDENVGGIQGNTHIALGNAYKDSFKGDVTKVSEDEWKEMGFNESVIHTDIVSTEQRTITATLRNGEQKVIYKDGEFTL